MIGSSSGSTDRTVAETATRVVTAPSIPKTAVATWDGWSSAFSSIRPTRSANAGDSTTCSSTLLVTSSRARQACAEASSARRRCCWDCQVEAAEPTADATARTTRAGARVRSVGSGDRTASRVSLLVTTSATAAPAPSSWAATASSVVRRPAAVTTSATDRATAPSVLTARPAVPAGRLTFRAWRSSFCHLRSRRRCPALFSTHRRSRRAAFWGGTTRWSSTRAPPSSRSGRLPT